MKRNTRNLLLASAAIAAAALNFACKKDNNNTPPPPAGPSVQLATSATFGSVMTDSVGRTLYFFSIDANGKSGCTTGDCLSAWPVFYVPNPSLATGLNASDFATITRTDGAKQTTYKGWPLYYFQGDAKAGDINGDKVENVWFVAKPDYSVMLSNEQLVGLDGNNYNAQSQPGTAVSQYLVDAYGHTLYAYSPDTFNKNNFTKADFSNNAVWPIDSVQQVLSIPSILDKTQFATLSVFGKTQLSYKGWPLYYFGKDNSVRGNTLGVSFPSPGIWPVLSSSTTVAPQ